MYLCAQSARTNAKMPKHEQNKQNNINNFNTQQKQMKKQYKEPQIYIENVVVESGIALSSDYSWGDPGDAGQDGWYDEYEEEL